MKEDLVSIYDAATDMEAQLLATRLADRGIRTFVDNNDSPLAGLVAAEQTITIRVLGTDEEAARGVVVEFMEEQGWPREEAE